MIPKVSTHRDTTVCQVVPFLDWLGNGRNTTKAGKTVENAIYKHFDSNIRPAYVKLGSAHNRVYGPAIVSALRLAIRWAKQ